MLSESVQRWFEGVLVWTEHYLFPSEYVLVEVELDLLVGNVDAELLKRVFLEVLKTEDVQDANVQAFVTFPEDEKNETSPACFTLGFFMFFFLFLYSLSCDKCLSIDIWV